MKTFKIYLLLFSVTLFGYSQTSTQDYSVFNNKLTNIDSVPEYASKKTPFKLSGKLYLEDGITPAANHIITLNQADENGDYVFSKVNKEKLLKHRAQVKTDAEGNYTFYTFVPGGDRLYNQLQELYLKVETPEGKEYALPTLFFDADPFLSKHCRKKMAKRNEADRILKLETNNNKQYATKAIVITTKQPLN